MATPTNSTRHNATATNVGISSVLGRITLAKLAIFTPAQLARFTFNSGFTVVSNQAKN